MPLTTLADYYFQDDDMFVVPIEALSPQGMAPQYATQLVARRTLADGWVALFNTSFERYWQRATDLAARAPQHWRPPRRQHCCIVANAERVRPYFQPFNSCAWLLYETDFDPATSNAPFATYLFFHMERMGLLRDVTQTLLHNLSYWLVCDDDEVASFEHACATTLRPDAAGFRALAEALPWLRRLHHETLQPAVVASGEPTTALPPTGLRVPRSLQSRVDSLLRQWSQAAQRCLDRFHATYARQGKERAGELCAWLRAAVPQLLITAQDGRIVWDPDKPDDIDRLRSTAAGLGQAAAASIRADLETIDRHSRAFLDSLAEPAALPYPHRDTAQNGLSYLHIERRLVAYNLLEPGMERLRVPAPPFERLMLGARTIHEWGHLAADAGWIAVPQSRLSSFEQTVAELRALFEQLYAEAPDSIRAHVAPEIERLCRAHGSLGQGLVQIPLARMPDYQANLLARRYLTRAEMETYVRNNVYCLHRTSRPAALFQRLARYAQEYQYLQLSAIDDPRAYFLDSTWFREDYLRSGLMDESRFDALVGLVGSLCRAQVVDETKLRRR